MTEEQPILASTGHTFPPSAIHIPPEITALSWNQFKSLPVNSFDSWGFGVLLYRIFNSEPIDQQSLTTLGNIPPTLSKLYKALLNPAPTSRISLAKFLEYATKQGAYFDDDFVNATIFLDEIALKSDTEKNAFVNSIGGFMDRFPLEFCKFKILPELLKALEFSGLGPSALKAALDIGARLDSVEFGQIIKPVALKLFASSDRAIRMALCENISSYVEHLTTDDIKNSVYDHLVTGFQDSNPRVREQTLKAITVIAPKLNSKTLNNSLLRFLAKLQTDPEPGIRTVTNI